MGGGEHVVRWGVGGDGEGDGEGTLCVCGGLYTGDVGCNCNDKLHALECVMCIIRVPTYLAVFCLYQVAHTAIHPTVFWH